MRPEESARTIMVICLDTVQVVIIVPQKPIDHPMPQAKRDPGRAGHAEQPPMANKLVCKNCFRDYAADRKANRCPIF